MLPAGVLYLRLPSGARSHLEDTGPGAAEREAALSRLPRLRRALRSLRSYCVLGAGVCGRSSKRRDPGGSESRPRGDSAPGSDRGRRSDVAASAEIDPIVRGQIPTFPPPSTIRKSHRVTRVHGWNITNRLKLTGTLHGDCKFAKLS